MERAMTSRSTEERSSTEAISTDQASMEGLPSADSMAEEERLAEHRDRRHFGLLWGGAVLALLLVSPWGAWIADHLWSCPFKTVTSLPCPGCGLTRAALALSHFEFVEALVRYPLATLLWTGFMVGGTISGGFALLGRPLGALKEPPRWLKGVAIAVLMINWVYSIATGV